MLSKKPTRNDRFVKTFVKECVCGVVINETNHRHNAFAIHIRRCVKAINSKRIHKCEGLSEENINDGNNELIMETNLVKEQTFELIMKTMNGNGFSIMMTTAIYSMLLLRSYYQQIKLPWTIQI